MIEELVIEELDTRMVCRYFPPHVRLEAQVMQKRPWSQYADLVDSLVPEGQYISPDLLSGGKAYQIMLDNGGAYYVCGELVDGYRECKLWKLTQRESE